MGSATLDLTQLELERGTELNLNLIDPSKINAQLGEIVLTATLLPKTQEDKEQVFMNHNVLIIYNYI